ncbi:MAG: peptidoglycan DD-metalloendopeptidase family protein [Actinobacteria bacterium]|nr:peptidoglycan DD-metalloendopeptidase family protein [Actinomycetota bacterium]
MTRTLCALFFTLLLGGICGTALAADPEERLDRTRARLGDVREREGLVTRELQRFGETIEGLRQRTREARVREGEIAEAFADKQVELAGAREGVERSLAHLVVTKDRLRRALEALSARVVAIYEAGTPDLASMVLTSHGYDDAASVAEYLERIQQADEALVERVRDLRDEARETVDRRARLRDRVAAAVEAIAARQAALRTTQLRREEREGSLRAAIVDRRDALAGLREREQVLEGDVSALQAEIEAGLAAAAGDGTYPSAPGGSNGTFVWPAEGTLTSTFGFRWGRQHEGIDIGAPEGTPIWAAADGTVVLQQGEYESGGYGNYTCVEHGSIGLTTCYAHQSAFQVSLGERVAQGQVIGLVGNTGNSFGAHLHFEVRVAGAAQDPLAYL